MNHPYPSWIHHREKESVIVKSEAEAAELRKEGWGWASEIYPQEQPPVVEDACEKPPSYREHMEAFEAKDEGEVKKPRRKAKS